MDIIEDMGLLQQLQILEISKPNKREDIFFEQRMLLISLLKNIEIRAKPILFIRKAKRILQVMVKGVHPEISNDMLFYELEPYVEHCSLIRHNEIHHRGITFWDGTKQVFVIRHI